MIKQKENLNKIKLSNIIEKKQIQTKKIFLLSKETENSLFLNII